MTECEMCGIDLDVEGWFTIQESDVEVTYKLCGHCSSNVKRFIERGI